MRLTSTQHEALRRVDEALPGARNAFVLRVSMMTLTSLWRLGLVRANGKSGLGQGRAKLPRTLIDWTITYAGVGALEAAARAKSEAEENKKGELVNG